MKSHYYHIPVRPQRIDNSIGPTRGVEEFLQYCQQAIDIDGPEVLALTELAKDCRISIVIGIIERSGTTLYCTALFITDSGKVRTLTLSYIFSLTIQAALSINPKLSLSAIKKRFEGSNNHPENRRFWLESLEKAGLPI